MFPYNLTEGYLLLVRRLWTSISDFWNYPKLSMRFKMKPLIRLGGNLINSTNGSNTVIFACYFCTYILDFCCMLVTMIVKLNDWGHSGRNIFESWLHLPFLLPMFGIFVTLIVHLKLSAFLLSLVCFAMIIILAETIGRLIDCCVKNNYFDN